ncbi:putative sodium-coupled neutral amino acid transporter 10 [Glossina fuscipes]|uniref:Sodium-coupled neutral amino acid transporter 10 n=1 Tax=Glossina fuscipes TaxID=7396 RepID=A0A8U0WLL0_9MUSC|nr:putative sodium-coupled neutral amino acid transporter 10 [Glossina fuscipes]XP_037886858.1 putative sodium-coupled neutral amino acid transporter 10 [Glossina fuscipes]
MLGDTGCVMTLANSIIGVGILAMPFCFQKCGILLSILLLIINNWTTRICCHYLIKSSLLTRRKSFEFLGFHAFGASGKLLVELCIIGYLLGTCITYFVVVGDLGPQILTKMFALEQGPRHLRTWLMCGVTLFCILPLAMLKNVDSLSTVCTASIGFYVCLVAKIILESKSHIMAYDWPNKVVYWQPKGILQCLPIFSMALSCQMQIFEVFTSVSNQSVEKLNGIVRNAVSICTFVYTAVGFFGYVAFCDYTFSGNILVNLSASFGSDVIKIGFVLSVAFSFPLVIFPCRASLYSLLYRKGQTDASGYIPECQFKAITVFIVLFALTVALMIPSVELIIGLVGSTIGVAICIMFPAACFRTIVTKPSSERSLAQLIIISGFCLMILGTYANLNAIDEKSSGAHLKEDGVLQSTDLPKDLMKKNLINMERIIVAKLTQEEEIKSKKNNKQTLDEDNKESKPPPPPLPVDEVHGNDERQVAKEVKEIKDQIDAKSEANNKEIDSKIIKLLEKHSDTRVSVEEQKQQSSNSSQLEPIQQTIDSDAIKKEDEAVKETSKLNINAENEVLKKTQKELEKTKNLLEKRVEELKEELVKQNQETQNLVVEKLGEVVEKFEQIERKVVQQQEKEENRKLSADPKSGENKLLSILANTNNSSVNQQAIASKVNENVTKPSLSVKNDLESTNVSIKLEHRLALPLPLLINNTQMKLNETLKSVPLKNVIMNIFNQTPEATPSYNSEVDKSIDKENVEAIRRDILQVKDEKTEMEANTSIDKYDESIHRVKRFSMQSLRTEDCLGDPLGKMESVAGPDLNSLVDVKFGRDLKSIQDEENHRIQE